MVPPPRAVLSLRLCGNESHQTFQVLLRCHFSINSCLALQPEGASWLGMPTAVEVPSLVGAALSAGHSGPVTFWRDVPSSLQMPKPQLPFITMDSCLHKAWIFYSGASFTSFSLCTSILAPTDGNPFGFPKATPFLPLCWSYCIDQRHLIEHSAVMETYRAVQ